MLKIMTSMLLLFCALSHGQQTQLLTGVISSTKQHLVSVPRGNSWQVQIQWMADEGTIVEAGDLVVVFDSGGIQTQLEQSEERLEMEKLEMQQIKMRLGQGVIEAQGRLNLANIMVDKTQIKATIPDGEISAYEKGKHVIAFEKALVERVKAQENYTRKLEEQKVGIEKQNIQLIKLQEDILYKSSQLERMTVRSLVTGPVSHMMHPHLGSKIVTGMNVQTSWNILVVQAQADYLVQTWIHELDAAQMDFAKVDITLSLDAYPETFYTGKLVNLSSQAEPKKEWSDSAYYMADIAFEHPPSELIFPGMSVRVTLNDKGSVQ